MINIIIIKIYLLEIIFLIIIIFWNTNKNDPFWGKGLMVQISILYFQDLFLNMNWIELTNYDITFEIYIYTYTYVFTNKTHNIYIFIYIYLYIYMYQILLI